MFLLILKLDAIDEARTMSSVLLGHRLGGCGVSKRSGKLANLGGIWRLLCTLVLER